MPNLPIFSKIRNHQLAELGISPIPGNVFEGTFFEEKNSGLKETPAYRNDIWVLQNNHIAMPPP
jgi:hypothetical protein